MRGVIVGVLVAWTLFGSLAAEGKPAPEHLTVRSLSVVDAEGRVRAYIGVPERPGAGIELTVMDERGGTRVSIGEEGGSTAIRLFDGSGAPSLWLAALRADERSMGIARFSTVDDSVVKSLNLGPMGVLRVDDNETTHRWPPK